MRQSLADIGQHSITIVSNRIRKGIRKGGRAMLDHSNSEGSSKPSNNVPDTSATAQQDTSQEAQSTASHVTVHASPGSSAIAEGIYLLGTLRRTER